jgi:hypothetical protein
MGLRQHPGQVGQDNSEEQPGEKVRRLRMPLPLRMPRLSSSVLLVGFLPGGGALPTDRGSAGAYSATAVLARTRGSLYPAMMMTKNAA